MPEHYYIVNATDPPSSEQVAAERERIRIEFFATYDVMTGVRIATTLGGFFGLMVFLVIYKSRGERLETMKALKVIRLNNDSCGFDIEYLFSLKGSKNRCSCSRCYARRGRP